MHNDSHAVLRFANDRLSSLPIAGPRFANFRFCFSLISSLLVCAVLVSCSGSSTSSTAPSFTLAVAPTTLTLTGGAAGTAVSVTATAVNAFTGSVAVALTGLPAGVTASPTTLTLTPGAAQKVTLTAAASAAAATPTVTFTGTSGTLSSAATLALTVQAAAPPPSFSLSATPTTLTLTAGAAGSAISVNATPANSFTGTVAVAITGLPTGVAANPATLSLTPGTAQSTTLTAAAGTAASTATVTFTGTSGTLTETATVALTVQAAAAATVPDVSTYHDDVARDGLNASETILTTANINSTQFGKIGFDTVDGPVDAEPLYAAALTVAGASHNVLYVATENDSVYAFDADSGAQLWMTSVIPSGEAVSDTPDGCTQIAPTIGVTSTPVFDRKQGPNGTIFVVGMTKDSSGNYHQRLHALDMTTGQEISGSPTEIAATYPGTGDAASNGVVTFNAEQYAERAALLLLNGNIYLTWTSHCDTAPYTGWIMAYSESTLQQTQALNITPNGSAGAIWMSGDGPAADSSGNIYFLDANGTFDTTLTSAGLPSSSDYGNAIIKLSTTGNALAVADYFNAYDTVNQTANDKDLGSGGEILLPSLTDSSGAAHLLIVGAGKEANIFLADTANLGKFNSAGNTNVYQEVSGQLTGAVFSTPAYFNGAIYYASGGDNLKAFPITAAKLAASPSSVSTQTFAYPGATPSVSANATTNGIVWACESSLMTAAVLHAYDATNLATELYNSTQAANGRDSFGDGNKYITPMIVNGKVYVGTPTGVAVFGLLTQ
jgi:hypothetical protein